MEIQGTEFSKKMYNDLNYCLDDRPTVYNVDDIIRNFKMCDINMVLTMLIDDRKELIGQINNLKNE